MEQLLNIRLYQAKSDITVKLLTPLIQDKAWAAFATQFVCLSIIGRQSSERRTAADQFLYGIDIYAMMARYLTLDFPSRNILAVAEKGAAKGPRNFINDFRRAHLPLFFPLLDSLHKKWRLDELAGRVVSQSSECSRTWENRSATCRK
jgi:hypothetical protein